MDSKYYDNLKIKSTDIVLVIGFCPNKVWDRIEEEAKELHYLPEPKKECLVSIKPTLIICELEEGELDLFDLKLSENLREILIRFNVYKHTWRHRVLQILRHWTKAHTKFKEVIPTDYKETSRIVYVHLRKTE